MNYNSVRLHRIAKPNAFFLRYYYNLYTWYFVSVMYNDRFSRSKAAFNFLKYPLVVTICFVLASCTGSFLPGIGNTSQCQSNCSLSSGVQGVQVFVEPDDGEQVITNAIRSAQKSIWLEIYILSDRNVIRTLEEA